uniref:Uncharacterized protein n=1 Tax=Vibrio parahaemolyticus TaxID=670 RepID=A0A1Y1BF45_VIBPH|nr:hypothetical protein [Vibrio parahaemolyticus]
MWIPAFHAPLWQDKCSVTARAFLLRDETQAALESESVALAPKTFNRASAPSAGLD